MKPKILFVVLIACWTTCTVPTAAVAGFDPYCGDSICQEGGCSFGGSETPGNGCVENVVNCEEDCAYCGDDTCSTGVGESVQDCIGDCGYCGDGVCFQPVETSSAWCTADCGAEPQSDCDECAESSECGSGEVCSTQHCCVPMSPDVGEPPACGGDCTDSTDCCGGDICMSDDPFEGKCAPPNDAVCPNAPSCSADIHCSPTVTNGVPDKYCDPGLGRCVYTLSSECVPASICPE